MTRLLVSQGEIGAMHPNNVLAVAELGTFAAAVPPANVALAFIATEAYRGPRHGEAEKQVSRHVTYVGYQLMDDQHFPMEGKEMLAFGKWAAAYDKCFGTRTACLPMAIRVGVNGETPEAAMSRLYPGMA